MADAAPGSADGLAEPGREDLRRLLATAVKAAAAAVTDLAARPDSDPARRMAELTRDVLREVARRYEVDAAVINAACARAVRQDREIRRRAREHLRRAV
jgi:dihydroorotase-like cyclic amidohydrolase